MKINFINKKDSKDIKQIDSFYLSKTNPRYTLIKSIETDLAQFITKENNEKRYDEKEVFLNLLLREGDFSDLLELLSSIMKTKFDNSTEPFYVVKSEHNETFIVAEGNRRLMCLKLIYKIFELPDFDVEIYPKKVPYSNENSNQMREQESDDNKHDNLNEAKDNYKKCKQMIKTIIELNTNINCYFEIADNSDVIWKMIYDKHLTGERAGLRKWPRSKYFADLINMLPDGISEDDDERFLKTINRSLDRVKTDYKSALFVYSILYAGKHCDFDDDGRIKNWRDESILNHMIGLDKISALEKIHSYDKIKESACKLLMIDKNQFAREYFDIKYKSDCLIQFKSAKIQTKTILEFIYNQWNKGVITTRPIKNEKVINFQKELSLILQGKNFSTYLTESELDDIDAFALPLEGLNKLISVNEQFYADKPDVIERFKIVKKIKENNNKFISIKKEKFGVQKIEPKYVFERLLQQLNNIDDRFINAKAATIRSIMEQLILWFSFPFGDDENKKQEYARMMASIQSGEIVKRKNSILNEITNDHSVIINWLRIWTKIEDSYAITRIINFLQKCKKEDNEESTWDIMNFCIHSNHSLYIRTDYEDLLKRFEESQEIVLLILDKIDFYKMNDLNDRMIALVSDNLN